MVVFQDEKKKHSFQTHRFKSNPTNKKTKHKLRAIFYFRWPWFGSIPTRNLLRAVRDVETVSGVFLCHRVGGQKRTRTWRNLGPTTIGNYRMLSLGPGELGLLLTIWMDDPLYTSCRNRFPIFHKISAISHMIFTNILPHIKSYKHHEIHLLFGKPPPRFDLTSCFILQGNDGKAIYSHIFLQTGLPSNTTCIYMQLQM